jgi:hypothetical protein
MIEDYLLIVKVGSPDYPASPGDIEDIRQKFEKIATDGDRVLITHHAITTELVLLPKSPKQKKVKVQVKKS